MINKIILTEESSILTAFTTVWIEAIKDEFKSTIDFTKNIVLTDFEDKKQFKIVKDTRNWYVKTRNTVKRAFKSRRDINTKENRENIEAEKEILAVIELEEKRLNDLVEKVELEQLKKDNSLKLIWRKELLEKYNYETDNEILLVMKDKDFEELLSWKKELYLEIKEQELKEKVEKERIEKEKKEAIEKVRLEEIEKAKQKAEEEKAKVELEKKEAEEKAKKEKEELERKQKEELERIEKEKKEAEKARLEEIEKEKQDKIELENKRIADLKQVEIEKDNEIARIKRENEQKESARLLKIEEDKQEEIKKAKKEKEEKEIAEKRQEFIKYRDSIDFDHYEDKDGKRIFYKKVWEFKIK